MEGTNDADWKFSDFYLYQDFEKIPEIRLKWGRDFYRYCNVKAENEEEKENG